MFWGTLQPSLPPRPSFPKSPSPQENTRPRGTETHPHHENALVRGRWGKLTPRCCIGHLPSSVSARVCASLLPHATCTTLCPRSTFTCERTESSTGPLGCGDCVPPIPTIIRMQRCPAQSHCFAAAQLDTSRSAVLSHHHFGLELGGVVAMAQPAVFPEAPGIQLPAGREGCTV